MGFHFHRHNDTANKQLQKITHTPTVKHNQSHCHWPSAALSHEEHWKRAPT